MKKIVFIVFCLSFFGVGQVWAQARIFNSTNEKVVVSDLRGLTEVVVNPRSSSVATFLSSDGVVKFNLARYEGYNKVSIGEATRLAKNGKIALKDLSLDDGSSATNVKEPRNRLIGKKRVEQQFGVARAETTQVGVKAQSDQSSVRHFSSGRVRGDGEVYISSVSTAPSSNFQRLGNPESGLVLSNQSSYRLTVLDGIFKGSALAAGQVSHFTKTVSTGKLTFSVYFDPEEDSISSGRNHRWAVINKIIVEGQDSLKITNSDLVQVSSGEEIKKAVRNNFDIDFLIVAGNNAGEVIPARKMTQLDLNIGWNYIPVEYLTKDGLPVRSIMLLMVNNSKRPLTVDRRSDADLDSVSPDQIVFSNSK